MINRKVLYGYQIRNGALEIVPEEQRTVSMVFTLYNAGASYQAISDALNRQSIPYCREVPLWNKHKVKRLLENPRYTGKEGYPILVEADIFQAAQEKTAEKNARKQSHGEKPVIARLTPYFRCTCGGKMTRLGGGWQNSGKLYLRCEGCGNTAVMDMDATVNGIVRQFRDHEQPSCTAYTPSAEVMRLDNAINRGLEQPDSPEAVMALILQGAAARYVWGTFGNVLTESLLEYKIRQYPDGVGNYEDFIRANWLNRRTTDCVGLIKGYGWLDTESLSIQYGTNGMPDYGANQMYQSAVNAGADHGSMSAMPEIVGLAVWKEGHIGVYIGGGYVIEAASTTKGVIKTQVEGRGWQGWCKIPYIDYLEEE